MGKGRFVPETRAEMHTVQIVLCTIPHNADTGLTVLGTVNEKPPKEWLTLQTVHTVGLISAPKA